MTPEEIQKLQALGWIPQSSPDPVGDPFAAGAQAAGITPPAPAPPPAAEPNLPPLPPMGSVNMGAVSNGQGSLMASGLQATPRPLPPPPQVPMPQTTQLSNQQPFPALPPMGSINMGAVSNGQGSLLGPTVSTPINRGPVGLDQTIAAANGPGAALPVAQPAVPAPAGLPEGSLVGDRAPGVTVRTPVPVPYQAGPVKHRPGLSTYADPYLGVENPYGGPNVVPSKAAEAAKPRGMNATDEYLASLNDQSAAADDLQAQKNLAVQATADADRSKSDALAAGRMEAAGTAQKQLADSQTRMSLAQHEADLADMESRQRATAIGNMKVDPDRYWKRKDTAQKIMSGIGILFSGIGQGLMKTNSNTSLDIIQAGINRDIDAQKADIENSKDSARMLDQISTRKFGRSMSMAEFEAHSRMDAYNFALGKTDAIAQQYDSPAIQGKADQLKAQLQGEINKTKSGLALQRYEVRTAQELAAAKAARTGDNSAALAKEYRGYVVKFQEQGDSLQTAQARAISVMGGPGVFKTELPALLGKPSGNKSGGLGAMEREQLRSYDTSLDYLNKIRDMIKAGGAMSPSRTAVGEALVAGAQNSLARAETGGHRAPSPNEVEILKRQIPADPNAWQLSGKELARIEAVIAQTKASRERVANSSSTAPAGPEAPAAPDVGFEPTE